MQLCGYSSRIVSLLGMGVHSPLLNMLPLRIPTWVPQDSVYLVTHPSVTHSRMPRPRYSASLIELAVKAVFQANIVIATKPITVRGCIPKLYAGLFLQNQQMRFLKWQRRRFLTVAGEANSTEGLINAIVLISTMRVNRGDVFIGL